MSKHRRLLIGTSILGVLAAAAATVLPMVGVGCAACAPVCVLPIASLLGFTGSVLLASSRWTIIGGILLLAAAIFVGVAAASARRRRKSGAATCDCTESAASCSLSWLVRLGWVGIGLGIGLLAASIYGSAGHRQTTPPGQAVEGAGSSACPAGAKAPAGAPACRRSDGCGDGRNHGTPPQPPGPAG